MTFKCNICLEGDMHHQFVITDKRTEQVTVLSAGTKMYDDMSRHVQFFNSQRTPEGNHLTHIYNCETCPNSQLEYHIPENAVAYTAAMNNNARYL